MVECELNLEARRDEEVDRCENTRNERNEYSVTTGVPLWWLFKQCSVIGDESITKRLP